MHKMKNQNQRKQAMKSPFIFFLWLPTLKQRILFITEIISLIKDPLQQLMICHCISSDPCLPGQVQLSGTHGTDDRSDGIAIEKVSPEAFFRRMCGGQQNGLHCPRDVKNKK